MNTKFTPLLLVLSFILFIVIGCTDLPAVTPPQSVPQSVPQSAPQPGSLTLLAENGNRVLLETDSGNRALLQIYSKLGHGSVDITIPNATYPDEIKLRLHLSGLEQLTLEHDGVTHLVSLSSSSDFTVQQSLTTAAGTSELASTAPEWATVGLVEIGSTSAASPTIPIKDGYIDVTMPSSFSGQQIRNFTIRWVDFYR